MIVCTFHRILQIILFLVLDVYLLGAIEGISPLVSCLDHTKKDKLLKHLSAGSGDLILFAVGQPASVNKTLDRLRLYVAHDLGLIDSVSLLLKAFNFMQYTIGFKRKRKGNLD